jgi:hypothetical protein
MNRAPVPPPASTRPRAGGVRALWLAALGVAGCALSQNGVDPPADTFFYPTSGLMSPQDTAGQWLYVANSNADLRFNDGTLLMLNVGDQQIPDPANLTTHGVLYGAAADRANTSWGQCPQADYTNPLPRSDAPICCRDLLDVNIINCDERRYTAPDTTVLIGSFAAQMIWQSYCDDPCLKVQGVACNWPADAGRILIGVRGDTSLTYVDVVPPSTPTTNPGAYPGFHCTLNSTGVATSLAECDQKVTDVASNLAAFNKPNGTNDAPDVALPDEPYALALDPPRGFLYVGHLVGTTSVQDSGGVSLFDASGTGVASGFPLGPRFIAPFPSPFGANTAGQFGITDLHLHAPLGQSREPPATALNTEIFTSSRYVPLVTAMVPVQPTVCGSDQVDDVLLPSGDTLNSGLTGSEMRGVEFMDPPLNSGQYAQRVYALQRLPPTLVGFDVGQNEAGATIPIPTSVTETCSSPTFLYQYPTVDAATADNPSRLFVNCFDTGEVYVFDPDGPTIITTLQVGRGPAGIVFDATRPIAYVLDFTTSNVSVIDLAPGSATQYHVIQRLGFPTVTPR